MLKIWFLKLDLNMVLIQSLLLEQVEKSKVL